jgi:hypothetical protein
MNHVGSIACLKVDKVGAKQNVVSRKAEEQNIFLSPTDKLSVGHHWQKTESDCFGMDVDCWLSV